MRDVFSSMNAHEFQHRFSAEEKIRYQLLWRLKRCEQKTAKILCWAYGMEQREAKGMKHRNKFQSSRLLVVWLVFLCISHSLVLCLCFFFFSQRFFPILAFGSLDLWLYIHSSISFASIQATTRICICFPFQFFFASALLRNILALNRMCVFACVCVRARTHTHTHTFIRAYSLLYSIIHSLYVYMCFTMKMLVLNIAPSIYQFKRSSSFCISNIQAFEYTAFNMTSRYS